jgi:hypothetical protein
MSDESKKKQLGHDGGGRSKYASSAVKRELGRIEQQAVQSSVGVAGSDPAGSPLNAENVVRAVLGKPPRADKEESLGQQDKRRSALDWPIAMQGGK